MFDTAILYTTLTYSIRLFYIFLYQPSAYPSKQLMRSILLLVRNPLRPGVVWDCCAIVSHVSQLIPSSAPTSPFETLTMYQSVLQRVCSTPQLLDLIFDHLDPASNVNNAIVCKIWSEVARDKLWQEVRSPRRLLSILAPISVFTGVSGVVIMQIAFG